jgi:hypothetical protein
MKAQIEKQGWTVIRNTSDTHITFQANGQTFVAIDNQPGFNIYRAFADGQDFRLLPGANKGKTFRTVINFVTERS